MPDATTTPLAVEHRDAARARILHAARVVLADRGLAATVDDVADAAGVNRRTVFRHFTTRDALFTAAIREGVRRYAQQIPPAPADGDLRAWLLDLLQVTHRLNARNGRVYWELAVLPPEDLSGELAEAAAERRASRKQFASKVTARVWQARGGPGEPPEWLVDAVAVQLSSFCTQSLAGDFGRTPDEVAAVSARVVEAVLVAALPEDGGAVRRGGSGGRP
ncbi:TetR/AcrR family transcriptional regulator [Pseudonocardia lacus]|uniref:TetR/AcrR family transcriptional regulator n=1 Tax=Pseudonocardia lacus TaxID=2835865 RepID=UPI001BDD2D51|nr:TetR/AcrR family transcriptional regulator [Pseudonocardia lacus]